MSLGVPHCCGEMFREDAIMGNLACWLNTLAGILGRAAVPAGIRGRRAYADECSAVGRFGLGRLGDRFDANAVMAVDFIAAAVFCHLEGFFQPDEE